MRLSRLSMPSSPEPRATERDHLSNEQRHKGRLRPGRRQLAWAASILGLLTVATAFAPTEATATLRSGGRRVGPVVPALKSLLSSAWAARAILASPPGIGDTTVVYGPQTFASANGAPAIFVEQLGVSVQQGTQYTLRVENGADGSPRVSAGAVMVGGTVVISAADLASGPQVMTRELSLTGADTLVAIVGGSPGAALRVTVLATADPLISLIGPTTYTKQGGLPQTFTQQVTVPSTVRAPFYLFVQNGNPDGSSRVVFGAVTLSRAGQPVPVGAVVLLPIVGTAVEPVQLTPDDTYTLQVTLLALAGSQVSVRVAGTDATPPTLTIDAPTPNLITRDTLLTVSGTVADAGPVQVTANGVAAAVSGGSYSAVVPLLADGPTVINVVATDAAGNSVDSTRTVTRDTQAPTLDVTSPTDQLVMAVDSVAVTGTVHDANAVTLNVNGAPVTPDSSGNFSAEISLVDGVNFLTVTATDAAENVSSVTRRVTYDHTPPTLTVVGPTDQLYTNHDSVTVTGKAFDASGVTVTVNGVPAVVGTDSTYTVVVPLTTDGPTVISIVATDAAGNTVTTTRTVTRDTQPPAVTVTAPADGLTTADASVTVSGTVTDASAVTVTINGTSATVTNGSISGSVPLTSGTNVITVIGTDAAGNTTTVTRTVTQSQGQTGPSFTETLGIDTSVHAPPLDPTVVVPLVSGTDPLIDPFVTVAEVPLMVTVTAEASVICA